MILQPDMVQRKGDGFQRLFPLLRLQFALPYRDAMPTHLCQLALLLLIALLIPAYLCHPEVPIGCRYLATCRIHNHLFHLTSYIFHLWQRHMMSMPEAPIHEDASPVFPQHQVRMPWQPLVIQSISESPLPQPTTHNHLRLRILRPNSRHVIMTLL